MSRLGLTLWFVRFFLCFVMVQVGGDAVCTNNLQSQSVDVVDVDKVFANTNTNLSESTESEKQHQDKELDSKAEKLFLEGANNEQLGNTAEATKLYVQSLEIVRDAKLRFSILHRLAVLNAKIKNYAESERYFRMALSDNNVNPTFLCDFAKLYADRNQLNDAETILKNAFLLAPNNRRTLFNLGQVVAQQTDRQAEGLRYLKLALGDKLAYSELAKIYRKLGSENQAQFAEQQALLAQDEPQKNTTTNDINPDEIPKSLVEKIKHELMLLEAKEIALVQDKILTDNERKLLTNPIETIKNQTPTPTPTIQTTPTASTAIPIPTPESTPAPSQPQSVSATTITTTATPLPVAELPLSSVFNSPPANDIIVAQKNNTPEIKRTPEVSGKFKLTDETTANPTQRLRPINFNETNDLAKNSLPVSSSQIRLIPYKNFIVDGVSDLSIVSLAKPVDNSMKDVTLSFAPNDSMLQNDRNKTIITVTQPTEYESSVKIRELKNQKDNNHQFRNIAANDYIRQNELRNESRQNTRPQNITENQHSRQFNTPPNTPQPYNRSDNVTNNMLRHPNEREFDPAFVRNTMLPKLELTETQKSNKPKSESESFLAFRLVSDSQPHTQPQPPFQPNTDIFPHKSPFQQEPQNIAPTPTLTPTPTQTQTPTLAEPRPTLVIHPIEIDNKLDNTANLAAPSEKIQNENELEKKNENEDIVGLPFNDLQTQINVTEIQENINPPTNTPIDTQPQITITPDTTPKIEENLNPLEPVPDLKNDTPQDVEREIERNVEQPVEKLNIKENVEVKARENVDLIFIQLPVDSQNKSVDNNVAQIVPKNEELTIPNLVDRKIQKPEIPQKEIPQTAIAKNVETPKPVENYDNGKNIFERPLVEVSPKIPVNVDKTVDVFEIGKTDDKISVEPPIVDSNLFSNTIEHEITSNTNNTKITEPNEKPQEPKAEKQIANEIIEIVEVEKHDDRPKESVAVMEPIENYRLPEPKTYILWSEPTITTQNTNENLNNNLNDKNKIEIEKILTNNIDNNETKIKPEITLDSQQKITTEFGTKNDLREDSIVGLEKDLPKDLPKETAKFTTQDDSKIHAPKPLPTMTLPDRDTAINSDTIKRQPTTLPDTTKPDQARTSNNETPKIQTPKHEQNPKNYWDNYSTINIDRTLQEKIDSLDNNFNDDDTGVSSTRKFHRNQNQNQSSRPQYR